MFEVSIASNLHCRHPGAVDQNDGVAGIIISLGFNQHERLCESIRAGEDAVVSKCVSELTAASDTTTAKFEAIHADRPDYLRLLLSCNNYIDESMVACAGEQKRQDCIRALIDFGWEVNSKGFLTASILCTAVESKEFAEWFIDDCGADINARSSGNESALSIALRDGHADVVELLFRRGIDIAHGDLLHNAAERANQYESARFIKYLAETGADVNAYRYDNSVAWQLRGMRRVETLLHIACEKDNFPAVNAILLFGADPKQMQLRAGNSRFMKSI